MTRWEPDAPGRLAEAALDLFEERGFEGTTVEDIASRAGVTKRTFFRHYADKREVLFRGGDEFAGAILDGLAAAPDDASPLDAAAHSLDAVAASFAGRHAFARRRQRVIAGNAELLERELVKLATVATTLASALRERGIPDPAAGVTAETAIAVFRTAFDAWVTDPTETDLRDHVTTTLATLRSLT